MSEDRELKEILAQMESLARRMYGLGFQAGSIAMRESILQVASSPMSVGQGSVSMGLSGGEMGYSGSNNGARRSKAESRAPMGLVAKAIAEVLTEAPGIRVVEVVERVRRKYPEIAEKSVGNQMRRGERDGAYERSDKYSWFLKGQAPREAPPRPEGRGGYLELD